MKDGRDKAVAAFLKDFGPFPPSHEGMIQRAVDELYNRLGDLLVGQPPKAVSRIIACGLLQAYVRQLYEQKEA